MANNTIPGSYAGLVLLSQRCLNGATSLGATIPLLINTTSTIGADRTALLSAQALYQAARGSRPALQAALDAARVAAFNFCDRAKGVLEFYLGRQHSAAWAPTGFISSLAVPKSEAGLVTLVGQLEGYLGDNESQENAELQVTAAIAGTVLTNLNSARLAVDAQVTARTTQKQNRDAKAQALRRRLSGLCKELSQRLGPLDPRWRDFGFNLPGAPTVPAVPQDVVVTPLSGARLQVGCSASANADHYRFFYQRPIEDPEPIFAGSAAEPLFVIEGLAVSQSYLVYVSAVNSGAESELSAPVSAETELAAAA